MREKNGAWAHWAIASAITCQRSGPDAAAFAAALLGVGDGAAGGGATFAMSINKNLLYPILKATMIQ